MYYNKVKRRDLLAVFLMAVLGFITYSNTFNSSFQIDDLLNIVYNGNIRMEEFSLGRLIRSSFPEYPFDRPVAFISFALNYYFGGLDVFGYHLVNIIIHILTGIGVYFLVKITMELLSSLTPSFNKRRIMGDFVPIVASALWLTNPVQTQAVTYIVQRMTSMAALFYVYSLLLYIRGRLLDERKKSIACLSLSFILFVLAIGTKQNTITLPLMIILYEIAFFRQIPMQLLREKRFYIPLFAIILAVLSIVYVNREYIPFATFFKMGYGVREKIFTEGRVFLYYITILLLPIPSKLSFFHDFPLSRSLLSPLSTLSALLLIVVAMGFSFYNLKKYPFVSFFTLWFFILLIPESILMLDLMYEHRLYLPSVGFFAIMAFFMVKMCDGDSVKKGKKKLGIVFLVVVLFSINTYARNFVWLDDLSLFSDSVKKSPLIPRPHEGLGMSYLKRERLEEAEEQFRIVKGLDPISSAADMGLGIIYYKRGDRVSADRYFEHIAERKAMGLETTPELDSVFYVIGVEMKELGRLEDAMKMFKIGLTLNPENVKIKEELYMLERGR